MVYIMRMYVDGGCRRNGHEDAIGAAACVIQKKWGRNRTWTRGLPNGYWDPLPTSQRAEIEALILALELALQEHAKLDGYPKLRLTIHTDSKYAHGCMTDWVYKWSRNGWMNAAGNPVANKDLIEKASGLDEEVRELGTVDYVWTPRGENQDADEAVNCRLNQMDNWPSYED